MIPNTIRVPEKSTMNDLVLGQAFRFTGGQMCEHICLVISADLEGLAYISLHDEKIREVNLDSAGRIPVTFLRLTHIAAEEVR